MGTVNNYTYSYETETKRIFPILPTGERIVVTHIKWILKLTHIKAKETIVFWVTKDKNHFDSRTPRKPISKNFMIGELDRMLGMGVGSSIYNQMFKRAFI